jgi:hypothetical protein
MTRSRICSTALIASGSRSRYQRSLFPELTPPCETTCRNWSLGFASERSTALSRFNDQLRLFEVKVVELGPEGAALQQIRDRGYAEKYRAEGLPMHLIGIEFSPEQRTLVGFETGTVMPYASQGTCALVDILAIGKAR